MPYYVGEDMPEWSEFRENEEASGDGPPVSLFKYIEPWQANAAVLPFPDTPGPEPELPQRTAYSQENWLENFRREQNKASAHALWEVSGRTATCRAAGVKRIFGRYDGGGDESFTYFDGVEMRDGRVVTAELFSREARGIDCGQVVEKAVSALMATFDAGEFILHGVVIVDFDACTITDEKNADVVFGNKMPWEV